MEWSRLQSITIHQLRVFSTVCRLLSYTRAAEELGCQQPTVSALLAELEKATQLTLLEQWGKRLLLTDEGQALYAHVQEVIAAADEAQRAMSAWRGVVMAHTLPLHIAADTTVGTYVLPHLVAAFRQQQPAVSLNLHIFNRARVRAALLANEVDLVLAGRPPDVEGVVAEPLLANPLVAIAAPEHVLIGQQQIPLERLAEETFLLREEGSGTRAAVEELFEVAGIPLKVGMVLGHIEAIKQAVAAGLGVSVLSALAIKREVRCGKLVVLDVECFPIQRRWYLIRLQHRPVSEATAAFIQFLHGQPPQSEW
jgi:DNA-binding transcriptional LysR family regulator